MAPLFALSTVTLVAIGVFGLFAALPNGTVVELPLTPTSRVQIIHNSPEPTVDVYAGNTRLIDNFAFRTATPFIDVPADRDIAIGIAGENSSSANDAIATFPVNLMENETYVVTAAGVVGNMGNTAFSLFINADAQETASNPANVDVAVFHGSPDAPAVDVDPRRTLYRRGERLLRRDLFRRGRRRGPRSARLCPG